MKTICFGKLQVFKFLTEFNNQTLVRILDVALIRAVYMSDLQQYPYRLYELFMFFNFKT